MTFVAFVVKKKSPTYTRGGLRTFPNIGRDFVCIDPLPMGSIESALVRLYPKDDGS